MKLAIQSDCIYEIIIIIFLLFSDGCCLLLLLLLLPLFSPLFAIIVCACACVWVSSGFFCVDSTLCAVVHLCFSFGRNMLSRNEWCKRQLEWQSTIHCDINSTTPAIVYYNASNWMLSDLCNSLQLLAHYIHSLTHIGLHSIQNSPIQSNAPIWYTANSTNTH